MPASAASTTGRPRRKSARRYHHGDLRRALLQEAVRIIGTEGIAGLTLREAGKRLGVSRTALYRHFPDKASLLAAVAQDGFERFREDLIEAWSRAGTRAGLEQMSIAYLRFATSNPSHYRVMFGDFRELCEKAPGLEPVARAAFQTLVDALVALQKDGLIRRDDPQAQAFFVWSVVHGLAMLAIDGQLGSAAGDPRAFDDLTRFVLARVATGIDNRA